MAWVDIFRRRFLLKQQRLQSDSFIRLQPAVPTGSLAVIANQVAPAHFQNFPFCMISTASQVGAAAWFVPRLPLVRSRHSSLLHPLLFLSLLSVSLVCSGHTFHCFAGPHLAFKYGVSVLNRHFVRRFSLHVTENMKKASLLALLQSRARQRAKEKEPGGDCVHCTINFPCSRGDMCGMKHDPELKRESKGK